MQRGRLASLAPLSGVVWVVLIVVAFGPLGGSTPNTTDPIGKVVSFYHGHYGREIAAAIMALVAALFLVWFGAAMRAAFIARDPATDRLGSVVLLAGAMAGTGASLVAGVHLALNDSVHHGYLGAVPALNALDNDLFPTLVVPLVLLVMAIAAAALRYALLPRWLGWVAVVAVIATFTPAAFFSLLVSLLLVIVVSVMVYRWQGAPAVSRPMAPTPPPPAPVAGPAV
jgi:hypothetical protein